jgi:murein peptide amidase A
MFMNYRFLFATVAALAWSMVLSGCGEYAKPTIVEPAHPVYTAPAPAPAPVRKPAPTMRIETVGRSVQGTSIKMYVFGNGSPSILIFGGIHGDEYTSAFVAKNLVFVLSKDPSLCDGKTVGIIPSVNPDGLVANTRTNANGVNLNRNFPASNWRQTKRGNDYGGRSPASEPETRAIVKAVDELNPVCIVSIHTATGGTTCNNYDGPGADIAQLLSDNNHYKVLESIGYPTPGSFGTWSGVDHNRPTITLELPVRASTSTAWQQNKAALLALIKHY